MTSVWQNSNANSAIVNTILASPSVHNPSVYSTKEITPPHAITWSNLDPSGGGPSTQGISGSSTTFQLSKFGIIEQILLTYSKVGTKADGTAGEVKVFAGDPFKCIQRIDLLSSSRVVSSLSVETLMAQFSNLSASQASPIYTAALNSRTSAALSHQFCLPVVFPLLGEIGTQLNSTFLEPMTVQVHWKDVSGFKAAGGAADATAAQINGMSLNIRYKNYPEESTSQILASNFAAPELNMLSSTWYVENTDSHVVTAGDVAAKYFDVVVDLKNTDAVEEFYVVSRAMLGGTDNTSENPLLNIESMNFTGSGQEIFNLTAAQMQYAKLTSNGFATAGIGESGPTGGMTQVRLDHVKCFQTGRYADSPGTTPVMSNCLSLREVNAPRMRVRVALGTAEIAGTVVETTLCERCLAIYAVSSSTGRLTLALSN
tara:strand:- start:6 stop:1292 length:1287 start_codon:yes stop_codon:yes gene_type:complete